MNKYMSWFHSRSSWGKLMVVTALCLFGYALLIGAIAFVASNSQAKEPAKPVVSEAVRFPRFTSVIAMLDSANDFSREKGTYKVVSETPLLIEISTQFIPSESVYVIEDETKRNIIYVALQAFSQTDIREIRLSSLPLQVKDFRESGGQPLHLYKQVMYVNRSTAEEILTKYIGTTDFTQLYRLEGSSFVPSKLFIKLMHHDLEDVFADMRSRCKCGLGYIEPA